jgi:hypothetical protein
VALERQKAGHDQDGFPLQKCAGKQHPVSMDFDVISEKLLVVHNLLPSAGKGKRAVSPQDKCVKEMIFCKKSVENNF